MARRRAHAVELPPLEEGYQLVDYDRIKPGRNNRQFFPGLEELATAIEESKRIQPLELTPEGEILSGERRWRSAGIVNQRALKRGETIPWPLLPCVVIKNEDDLGKFDVTVSENAGRAELCFIEWARTFKRYREDYRLSNDAISRKTGFDPSTVSSYISVLEKVHPSIIERLNNGEQIPVNVLITLRGIKDKDVQLLRLNQWLGNPTEETDTQKVRQRRAGLSRRKMLALIKLLQESQAAEETIAVAQFMAGMRETLPHKWHQRLSRNPTKLRRGSPE